MQDCARGFVLPQEEKQEKNQPSKSSNSTKNHPHRLDQAEAFVFDTGVWTGLQKLNGTVFKAAECGGRNELVRTPDHAAAILQRNDNVQPEIVLIR